LEASGKEGESALIRGKALRKLASSLPQNSRLGSFMVGELTWWNRKGYG
jgi:hypothetical protein